MTTPETIPQPSVDRRRLVIRADASAAMGTGHVMRAFALAQAWHDRGGESVIRVAEAPGPLIERIEQDGVAVDEIPAGTGPDEDAAAVLRVLRRDAATVVAIDGPGFDEAYLDVLAPADGRVLVVDDLAALTRYPVGTVLNQNAHADRGSYPVDATCRFLLGTRYVLLRREFVPDPPPRSIPSLARNLLVTLGGADPSGTTERCVAAIGLLPGRVRDGLAVRVVVGSANPAIDRISSAVTALAVGHGATVEQAATDMPGLMAWADLAVTSGGSTVWELARTGCPSLVVETAPIEARLATGLDRIGLFDRLGPATELGEQRLADAIAARVEDVAWRMSMSTLGRDLVDGRGAGRVVDALAVANGHMEVA